MTGNLPHLLRTDPRLVPIAEAAGSYDMRQYPSGFHGLARVICGQQVSVASARAIFNRLAAVPGALDPAVFLALTPDDLAGVGLSRGKFRTLTAVATAILSGSLRLDEAATLPADAAIAHLVAQPGIGPWTAEIYLMFCVGHPDIFPSGDLALRRAVGHAFGIETPSIRETAALAEKWAPHRHEAALLFWAYYAKVLRKAGGIAL